MYRVGIIQNESEAIRSGYANVHRNLLKIGLPPEYSLELFNVVNIDRLFHPGDDLYITNFDSIVVTTNATSDLHVRQVMESNQSAFCEFLQLGRGLFVSSQKKLGVADGRNLKEGRTGFLPDTFDFQTIQRPNDEKDSGQGVIKFAKSDSIVLKFPNIITEDETRDHCINNGFRRHMYRSMIKPIEHGVYEPLIVDQSYSAPSDRWLLVTNSVSQQGERIVLSTIAIDWELHDHLLENIILFITEGVPKVAFINKDTMIHDDFDYLVSSAKLSKVSCRVYDSIKDVEKQPKDIHTTFIFSPGFTKRQVEAFVKRSEKISPILPGKKYMRVYYFQQFKDNSALVQYSNFSTFDVLTDNATLWIESKYRGKMWDNSFWTTYEILSMMLASNVDMHPYISGVLKDIKKHYNDASYDNVAGATCGLFELLLKLRNDYSKDLVNEGFDDKQILRTGNWLLSRYATLSLYDLQTLASIITRYRDQVSDIQLVIDPSIWNAILDRLKVSTENLPDDLTEQEECRAIELSLIFNNAQVFADHLVMLHKKQDSDGKWTNVRRTADVLVFFLKNVNQIKNDYPLDDMLYHGVRFLYGSYNKMNSNWDNDIQTTAQAIQAINLYNSIYSYSTQDFLSTLGLESDKVYAASVMRNVSVSMNELRDEITKYTKSISVLNSQVCEKQLMIDDQQSKLNLNQSTINELNKEIGNWKATVNEDQQTIKRSRGFSFAGWALFLSVIVYLAFNYPQQTLEELIHIDILGIVIAFVFGLIASLIISGKIDINK